MFKTSVYQFLLVIFAGHSLSYFDKIEPNLPLKKPLYRNFFFSVFFLGLSSEYGAS